MGGYSEIAAIINAREGKLREEAKQRQKEAGEKYGKGIALEESAEAIKKEETREVLAKIAGVSHDTIHKIKKINRSRYSNVKTVF